MKLKLYGFLLIVLGRINRAFFRLWFYRGRNTDKSNATFWRAQTSLGFKLLGSNQPRARLLLQTYKEQFTAERRFQKQLYIVLLISVVFALILFVKYTH
jgi:hypothetical protein